VRQQEEGYGQQRDRHSDARRRDGDRDCSDLDQRRKKGGKQGVLSIGIA
jgi:hypothetical protein